MNNNLRKLITKKRNIKKEIEKLTKKLTKIDLSIEAFNHKSQKSTPIFKLKYVDGVIKMRGRPKGSKNKTSFVLTEVTGKRRGRPKGSKNKTAKEKALNSLALGETSKVLQNLCLKILKSGKNMELKDIVLAVKKAKYDLLPMNKDLVTAVFESLYHLENSKLVVRTRVASQSEDQKVIRVVWQLA